MFAKSLFFLLTAASSALATISIMGPSPSAYWVQNASNLITWSFSQGDPNPIDITVTNANSSFLNGAFSIARNVDLSNGTFTVTNVTLVVASGYVVNFVNGTNETQVYASSGQFDVKAPGTTPVSQSIPAATPTSPSGNSSGTGSGTGTSATHSASSAAGRSVGGDIVLLPVVLSVTMAFVGAFITL
ncbi:hypothetical protein BD410DRAFT_835663 [Rickenella mellea]|uniref:Yeast cell wall synthesis Kre9/Knh1-like N-terminal domain-containing protein n=1 Tax=Rickenella mellea TaxID=50990 RepID=A0A4Y7QIC9_9AGAM|nr:hypothetical protein BD410DRAFT_835663 [Rickenella mellea]